MSETKTYQGSQYWPQTRDKLFYAIGENRLPKRRELFLRPLDACQTDASVVEPAEFDFTFMSAPIMKEVGQ